MDNGKPKWVVQEELGEEFLSVHLKSLWKNYGVNHKDMPFLVWFLMAVSLQLPLVHVEIPYIGQASKCSTCPQ